MSAGSPEIVAAFGTTRTISFYHIHTKETLTVTYKRDGTYDRDALKKIDWLMRDWRQNVQIEIDPVTIDLLWEMHTELGSKEPIHVICGHRSNQTNGMLRKKVGGQAKNSLHITGKAVDVAFPDIPVKQLRYSALIRERGGVGYYPTSGIPFVHVDSGPVRAWPRLPRYELALLFPDGRTKHRPASGGPISRDDVRIARSRHKDLEQQVAAYFDIRNKPRTEIAVAEASPPAPTPASVPAARARPQPESIAALVSASPPEIAPQLKGSPRLVRASLGGPADTDGAPRDGNIRLASLTPPAPRPLEADRDGLTRLITASADDVPGAPMHAPMHLAGPAAEAAPAARPRPSPAFATASSSASPFAPATRREAAKPTRLAALEPQPAAAAPAELSDADASGFNDGWAPAAQFDEDHPEELSYRPFPIAPFLTESPSIDDTALVKLVHPTIARTLDLLDKDHIVLPLRLRPGRQVTEVSWAQQFRGDAVDVSVLEEAERERNAGRPASLAQRSVRTTAR